MLLGAMSRQQDAESNTCARPPFGLQRAVAAGFVDAGIRREYARCGNSAGRRGFVSVNTREVRARMQIQSSGCATTVVRRALPTLIVGILILSANVAWSQGDGDAMPSKGFRALFDGESLSGWWGVGTDDPRIWSALSPEDLAAKMKTSRKNIRKHWSADDGELVNDGRGLYLTTDEMFGDFELLIDYKTVAKADSGIYLRGTPQVQIWDSTKAGGKWRIGADKGSGGLWNNPEGQPGKNPLVLADKPFGEWNHFRIVMVGERVSVWLNEQQVVDHARMVNYFDQARPPHERRPLLARGPIQLQTHGGETRWRNLWLRDIEVEEANEILRNGGPDKEPTADGFVDIFNGRDFEGWAGPTDNYEVRDGTIVCKPRHGGTIYHHEEYSDFVVELEIRLPPGGNNGLAIRYPGKGDTAYVGMCELQVLDNTHKKYARLDNRQYHGSVYGQVAAERGYLRAPGEWNFQRVHVEGSRIAVELNGSLILDRDLSAVKSLMYKAEKFAGRKRTRGFFGLAGHSDPVQFRALRIKRLDGK